MKRQGPSSDGAAAKRGRIRLGSRPSFQIAACCEHKLKRLVARRGDSVYVAGRQEFRMDIPITREDYLCPNVFTGLS